MIQFVICLLFIIFILNIYIIYYIIKHINNSFNDINIKLAKLDKTISVFKEVYSSNYNKSYKYIKHTDDVIKNINNKTKDLHNVIVSNVITNKDKTSK